MQGNQFKFKLIFILFAGVFFSCSPATSVSPAPETVHVSECIVREINITPDKVMANDPVEIVACLENKSDTTGTYQAILCMNNIEVENREMDVAPMSTRDIMFNIDSPDKAGEYLITVGDASAKLLVNDWQEYEIIYDKCKGAISDWAMGYSWYIEENGLMSYFKAPSRNFRIKKLIVDGFWRPDTLPDPENYKFTINIWNDAPARKIIWTQNYPYSTFSNVQSFKEFDIPDIRTDGNFYVEVIPRSARTEILSPDGTYPPRNALYVCLCVQTDNPNASVTRNGNVTDWPQNWPPQNEVSFMVRVEGEGDTEVERHYLYYDSGKATASYYSSNKSYLIDFSPPAKPFFIDEIQVFGWLKAAKPEDYEHKTFTVILLDKESGKELWSYDYPWKLFKEKVQWVQLGVPGIQVENDFYIELTTGSSSETALYIDFDSSLSNEHSYMSRGGRVIDWQSWTWDNRLWNQEKVNWMIRVNGCAPVSNK